MRNSVNGLDDVASRLEQEINKLEQRAASLREEIDEFFANEALATRGAVRARPHRATVTARPRRRDDRMAAKVSAENGDFDE